MITWQIGKTLKQNEKEIIQYAFRFYSGNRSATASALGIDVRTLFNKLAEYESADAPVKKDDGQNVHAISDKVSSGMGAESLPDGRSQRSLPVRESEEVQKVPSKSNGPVRPNRKNVKGNA